MPEYHYNNDPKDTYTTLLSVGTKTNPGLHATTQRSVWTDDGDDSKSDAPFQLAMDAMQMQGSRRLEFNDAGTYIHSAGDGTLDLVSDGTSDADAINIESASGITLDAGDATYGITYEDDTIQMLRITNSTPDVIFKQLVNAGDIVFQQDDGNEVIRIGNDRRLYFYDEGGEYISSDGTDFTFESGAKINLNASSDVHIPNDVGIVFGGASEKIEGDGTDLTISANNLTVDCAADIILDAGGGDVIFKDDGTEFLRINDTSSSHVTIKTGIDSKDIIFQQYDGAEVARIEDDTYLSIAVGLRADSQDGATIGTSSYQFSDLFLADGAVIALGNDGDITLTHVADTGITMSCAHANGTNFKIDNTAGDGDSVIQLAIGGTTKWSVGCEDNDSDKFVIENGAGALGAAPALEISSAGAVNIPGALTTGSMSYSSLSVSQEASASTATVLTLDQSSHSDTDGHRQSQIVFTGERGGTAGAEVTMAKIIGAHDGGADDQKGYLEFTTNSSADDATPTTALKLSANKLATFAGDLSIPAAKKLYLDGGTNTYIHESSSDVVQIVAGGAVAFEVDANSKFSLSNNDDGSNNTILGKNAGLSIDAGSDRNVFIGDSVSDASMADAINHVGIGYQAMSALTSGTEGVAIGYRAMYSNTTGNLNTHVGNYTAGQNQDGDYNTSIGANSSYLNVSGNENTAVGYRALEYGLDSYNTAVGFEAGMFITTGGQFNTFMGHEAGRGTNASKITGDYNSAFGADAGLGLVSSASYNTLVGGKAGRNITSGTHNIMLGNNTAASGATVTYEIVIGAGVDSSTTFDGAGTETTRMGRASDYITNDFGENATWTHSSDMRIKKDIEDNSLGLAFINNLRTVTFKKKAPSEYPEEFGQYDANQTERKNPDKKLYGFIAQEVKEAMDIAGHSEFTAWSEGKDGMQELGETELITPLVKAIQELTAKVEALENK